MPAAQSHLAALRKSVGGVLRTHGFEVRSEREWVRGDDDSGWVVITWWADKWNTQQSAEASLTATVWPAGTREHLSEVFGGPIEVTGGDGPLVSAARVAAMEVDARAYAESLVHWAGSMLDARRSAPRMRHDHASRRYGNGSLPSPRAELEAGIGTKVPFDLADGPPRLPEPTPTGGPVRAPVPARRRWWWWRR